MRRTFTLCSILLAARASAAEPPRVHAAAGAGHAFTAPQDRELGWGGGGGLALEVGLGPLARHLGAQLGGDVFAFAAGEKPRDPSLAPRTAGTLLSVTSGLRVHVLGFWVDGNGGVATSGSEVRPTISAHVGYDLRLGKDSPWVAGPLFGYVYVWQPKDALRPEDAHFATIGLHLAYDPIPRRPIPVLKELAKRAPPPPEPPSPPPDADKDGVADAEDACPAQPGARTDDPLTSGCPRLREVGDQLVLADRVQFDFDSPKVKTESVSLLQTVAEWIVAHPDVIEVDVDGHSDAQGNPAYNLALSRARALNVKEILRAFGVTCAIAVQAYGDSRPVVPGEGADAHAQNRRVEFHLRRQEETPHAQR